MRIPNKWTFHINKYPKKTSEVVIHKIIEITKWIIGEKSLIAHSSFPNNFVDNPIVHAMNGGFVKYPKSRFWDQCQYWASSTDNSMVETNKVYILIKVIKINVTRTTGVLSFKELSFVLLSDSILISPASKLF